MLKDKSNVTRSPKRQSPPVTNEPRRRRNMARRRNGLSTREVVSPRTKGRKPTLSTKNTTKITSDILEEDFEFEEISLAVYSH